MKKTLLAALLSGAATVGGFAPFEIFPLPFITLLVLFLLWRGAQTARYAALIGFAWGLGFFLTGVSWVYVSLHDVGGMPLPLAAVATLLFCGYLAIYPALAGYLFKRLAVKNAWRDALLAAGVWTLSEWLRGTMLTGFPWLSLGYSQVGPSPFAGYATLVGSYGVTFVLVFVAALLASGWWRLRSLTIFFVMLVVGAALKLVPWTSATGNAVSVSLLQGNIPQSLKWDPTRLDMSVETYRRLAQAHPAQLIVLPETAIPLLFEEISRDYLRQLVGDYQVLLGVAARAGDKGYVNAAILLNKDGPQGAYTKTHLVPFGEYVPPGFSWFFDWVRIPMTDFEAGIKHQPPLSIANLKVSPNICFEDLFGEEIIRHLPEATVLINLSNTAWFGKSLAQPQHLQISRMRAIETGRPMLRATNTGMTAVINPDGKVSDVLPEFTEGALTTSVQGYSGTTPYVRIGNAAILLLSLAAFLPALQLRKSRR